MRVQGSLIRWARQQQEITHRVVISRGGPGSGYQSEVEQGKKTEVTSETLSTWARILNVTEAFLCGQVPRFSDDPAACRGLAGDIGHLIRSRAPELPDWPKLTFLQRAREVLRLVAFHSAKLPLPVLAWVLEVEVRTLDAMISGLHPIGGPVVRILSELTTLPQPFFVHGRLYEIEMENYLPVLDLAKHLGVQANELEGLVRFWAEARRTVSSTTDLRNYLNVPPTRDPEPDRVD